MLNLYLIKNKKNNRIFMITINNRTTNLYFYHIRQFDRSIWLVQNSLSGFFLIY